MFVRNKLAYSFSYTNVAGWQTNLFLGSDSAIDIDKYLDFRAEDPRFDPRTCTSADKKE